MTESIRDILFTPTPTGFRGIHPTGQPSMAKQEFKDQCDINLIVKRYAQRGLFDHVSPITPTYGDASQVMDLQQAMDLVDRVKAEFDELPAEVRRAALNDPMELRDMLTTEAGVRQLQAAGMKLQFTDDQPEPSKEAPGADGLTSEEPPAPPPSEPSDQP